MFTSGDAYHNLKQIPLSGVDKEKNQNLNMMSEACCFVKMLFRRVQLRRRRFASILLIVSSGIVFVLYFEAYGFFFSVPLNPRFRRLE